MDVGIGLPATIAGIDLTVIGPWAARAEAAGFSSVSTIDRIAYGNADPLVSLAAAAGATSRIRLTASVLLAPLRQNGVVLGKQTASLNALSGGRFTLGMSAGGRQDDFDIAGVDFKRRGRSFDRMLDEMEAVWSGSTAVGPASRPEVLIGGNADAAIARAVKHGDGWVAGGGGPFLFQGAADKVRKAWADAGREGQPRLAALGYFALGDDAEGAAAAYLKDYYAFLGPIADMVAAGALTSAEKVKESMSGFADLGCDELLLFPCSADPSQVDRLAEVAL